MPAERGRNLPEFRDHQLAFCAHIRHPDVHARPTDIEDRRMAIYRGLFFRNIESFLASAFPVAKSCLDDAVWNGLVREFIHQHACQSPYFLEISAEFLAFVGDRGLSGLPAFLLELCHYEWLELALDVAEIAAPASPSSERIESLQTHRWQVSPLVQVGVYRYPVHTIGADHQPQQPDDQASYLVVYRNHQDQVRFLQANPLTHRLLALLDGRSVDEVLQHLHQELRESGVDVSHATVFQQGCDILKKLAVLTIVVPDHN